METSRDAATHRTDPRRSTSRRGWIGASLLLLTLAGSAAGLVAWKEAETAQASAAVASMPEPMEAVSVVAARRREHVETTTSIGTVLALRSVTLRNELPGTVRHVALTPGEIVEEGTLLVALDVSVEEAELASLRAQVALAETLLGRLERAIQGRGASELEVDRARAERDVALAQVARIEAIIERKTVRAPFRARVGLADVHPGQYLSEGTYLTTLQGVGDALHVDFAVAQAVAASLREGDEVDVFAGPGAPPLPATIVALDARIDAATRNATVRARLEGAGDALLPGGSVRVRVPVGAPREAVAVPVSALRKGPEGDHVFVVAPDAEGRPRAHLRAVQSGAMLGDEVVIREGLEPGEQVAASGSFKLREETLLAVVGAE